MLYDFWYLGAAECYRIQIVSKDIVIAEAVDNILGPHCGTNILYSISIAKQYGHYRQSARQR
jgi:hypothetical protein